MAKPKCVLLGLACFASSASALRAQATLRLSVASNSGDSNGGSCLDGGPVLSGSGALVAFDSLASNLVALADNNQAFDVFVRDTLSGTTERVSVSSSGVLGDADSYRPSISLDGRFVAFESYATNLGGTPLPGASDVYVRDRLLGVTHKLSSSASGGAANGMSGNVRLSGDGLYAAFESDATNLGPTDLNGEFDIYVHEHASGLRTLASLSNGGAQANRGCYDPDISEGGRFVVFISRASNLVLNDTNDPPNAPDDGGDVFLRDRVAQTTVRVSVSSSGQQATDVSGSPTLSADGRFVAFASRAWNLVPGDSNGKSDVFVHDAVLGTTRRVSVSSLGTQANQHCDCGDISADGRFVAFYSSTRTLVPGDLNAVSDIFVFDQLSGQIALVSTPDAGGQSNEASYCPTLSADGRFVGFASYADNLVAGDGNGDADAFLRDRGLDYVGTFCTAGTTTNGCTASIQGSGTPSASGSSSFVIQASALEGQRQGLLFYGLDDGAFTPLPWGTSSSFLCVKPPTQRTSAQSTGGSANACNGSFAVDWNAFVASNPGALGVPFSAGQHVFVQAWFRDPPSPKTTHLSDALEFVLRP
ncbi:MAG: PD40 domain-containing protein [Planctomycetes bacterium]|nr:PD40 domain-containing protein [Planctomycetota bacterium]